MVLMDPTAAPLAAWFFEYEVPRPDDFKGEGDLVREKDLVAGVYLLVDFDGKVVYVGQSGAIQLRARQHRRSTKRFSTIQYYPVEDVLSRLWIEGILILGLRPKYNRALSLGFAPGKIWELRYNVGHEGPAHAATTARPRRTRKKATGQKARKFVACEGVAPVA